jgi:cyclopropane-fatty-acyl-phospholipid synthase
MGQTDFDGGLQIAGTVPAPETDAAREIAALPAALEQTMARLGTHLPPGVAFGFQLPGRPLLRVGCGEIAFRISVHNERAVAALKSLDELRIGEAYIFGDLDIEGNLLAAFDLRNSLCDRHSLSRFWSLVGQRLILGRDRSARKWIKEHYDTDPEFYFAFLDRQARCYSHGYFEDENEPLEAAIQRKLATAMEAGGIEPGMEVLDVGGGWGSFTEFAGRRGVRVTSLTLSSESEKYVNGLIARAGLPCRIIRENFLEYDPAKCYDAIVNLGVTEHLPDYAATLAQYQRLLKPGGRVYLDASACRAKFSFSTFILNYVYPGDSTPLHLAGYLDAVSRTPFELIMLRNDRHNYTLTAKHWATRLDENREMIIQRWGETLYRRFRLYLWGCVHCFATDTMTAYRWVLQLPQTGHIHTPLSRPAPGALIRRIRRALAA